MNTLMPLVEVVVMVCGFGLMVFSSQRAVAAAQTLAVRARVPPFLLGFSLLAFGTDMPEMANSVVSSLTDHGDINVGDSVGSAATQVTLVLGILGIWFGPLKLPDTSMSRTAGFTAVAMAALMMVLSDGHFGRVDALVMFGIWAVGSAAIYRMAGPPSPAKLIEDQPTRFPLIAEVIGSFAGLGLAAVASLWAVVQIAERLEIPEFVVGFFLASLGTSLPELVFDVTAIRRGSVALALGDIVGSSFIDATAAVAIGPLISPTAVTPDLVLRGTLVSMVALVIVALVLSLRDKHDWRSGLILLLVYGGFFIAVL